MALFPIGRTPSPKQRELRNALIAGGLILALFITVAHLWSRNDDSSNPVNEPYYIKAQKDEGWIEKLAGDPVALFTLILTGATIGLYLATRSLFVATERLVLGSESTAERQLRAYVGIERVGISNRDANGSPTSALLVLKNYGQTPAMNQRVSVFWGHQAANVGVHPDNIQNGFDNPSTFMPGAVAETIFHATDVYINTAIIGRVEYTDVFGKNRYTNIRLLSKPGLDTFRIDTYGNDSD